MTGKIVAHLISLHGNYIMVIMVVAFHCNQNSLYFIDLIEAFGIAIGKF